MRVLQFAKLKNAYSVGHVIICITTREKFVKNVLYLPMNFLQCMPVLCYIQGCGESVRREREYETLLLKYAIRRVDKHS